MANPKSQADIMLDIEALLEAADRSSPEIRAATEAERQALAQSLTTIKRLKARQEELTALRQEVTQQLGVALVEGKENAMIYRLVVRGKLGPRNERLVHYKVSPLRKRKRNRQAAEKPLQQEATVAADGAEG